jgi:uncharacterized membrane protein YphA (DoxX/SURF4 family)
MWVRRQPWVSLSVRLALAAVFLAAGMPKLFDLAGSARAVNAYQLAPWQAAQIVGAILPFLETGLGLLFLAGVATRLGAVIGAVMMAAFIAGIASAWARGLSIDCGCFSAGGPLPVGVAPNYTWDIARDLAFLALAGFLAWYPASAWSLDGFLLGPQEQVRRR